MLDGMAGTTHRIPLALDQTTAQWLKRLAVRWQVSQAEGVRRAVALAESEAHMARRDPLAMLRDLHQQGRGFDPETADAYLAEVREDRGNWRGCELRELL